MNINKKFHRNNTFQYLIVLRNTHILISIKDELIESRNLRDFDIDWKNENYCRLGTFIFQKYLKVSNSQLKGEFISIENGNVNHEVSEKLNNYICYKYFKNFGLFERISEPVISILYDIQKDKIIWEREYINDVCGIHEQGVYARGDKMKSVDFYSLENGSPLWQFSVSELGKRKWVNGSETIEEEGQVSKIIGIMGEVLVVVITGGGDRDRARTQLIGLHTQTGELLWLLDGFEHEGITHPYLPTTATLMPDAQNEVLVGFQNRYFIEIDPQVGKVTRCHKIDDQSQIHNLATIMDSFSLQGDHLYFRTSVSSMGGFPTAIGAFNYKTETIEWLHVFEEFAKEGKFIPINQPKAEGNRVYALDSGNTLHIFEREQ